MLDIFNIPTNASSTQTFYASSGSNLWQTWEKPRGAKMIEFFLVGAGGGGGQGATSTIARAGGAGGGSAGITKGLIPAFLLPDTLYIQVPIGVVGASGSISYVSLAPTASANAVILASSTGLASPGAGLGGGGSNVGGAGATIFTNAAGAHSTLSIYTAIAGVTGITGVTSAGSNISSLASSLVTGGAGGAGHSATAGDIQPGGSVLSASVILTSTVQGGLSGSSTLISNGKNGYTILSPFCSTGGGGGAVGSGSSYPAGTGGGGGIGSGGGGGSAAYVAGFGSTLGGKGGDGIVIITTIS